jgi:hypothetical protein
LVIFGRQRTSSAQHQSIPLLYKTTATVRTRFGNGNLDLVSAEQLDFAGQGIERASATVQNGSSLSTDL